VSSGSQAPVEATRVLANVLGMQRAGDPLVFASMTLLLSLVALAPCVLPAHHATRISPTTALRHE
jgi:ABC-type lipoprotein release transport system permease subunit